MYLGNGQVLWTSMGRNKTLPPSTSPPFVGEIAGVNTAPLDGCLIVRELGPGGRKVSNTNSTATYSTWSGMGLVRLYLANESS